MRCADLGVKRRITKAESLTGFGPPSSASAFSSEDIGVGHVLQSLSTNKAKSANHSLLPGTLGGDLIATYGINIVQSELGLK